MFKNVPAGFSPLEFMALWAGRTVVFTALAATSGALLSNVGYLVNYPVDPGVGACVGMGLYLLRVSLFS